MAIFGNGYPATYQQSFYPQYPQAAIPQAQSQQTGLIWIQGEQAAKSYLVAPNTTVALFDSEAQSIYLKSADASGMPSMKILDYTIRGNGIPAAPVAAVAAPEPKMDYATKEEVEALTGQITAIKKQLDRIKKGAAEE